MFKISGFESREPDFETMCVINDYHFCNPDSGSLSSGKSAIKNLFPVNYDEVLKCPTNELAWLCSDIFKWYVDELTGGNKASETKN
jgi:hypothetical protein